MQQKIDIIKSLLEEFLVKMTIKGEVNVVNGGEFPQFIVRTADGGILIGENGKHLIALTHLFKKITEEQLKRQNLENIQFLLDINDYQVKKIEEMKNFARMNAQRVRYFKKEIELEPMTSYDRRIVHATLTEYPDIVTESVGEDPNRRIIIKYFN